MRSYDHPIEQALYESIRSLPIVSPHGHTDPAWFADDRPFATPADLLIVPDHYVYRLLYSHGVPLESLGVGVPAAKRDSRAIFRTLAAHWHRLLGTPSRGWLSATLRDVFGIDAPLTVASADVIHDHIAAALAEPGFRPCALLERFGIEALATTDGALDDLDAHARFASAGHATRLMPTFRPDSVLNPVHARFVEDVHTLGELTGENVANLAGFRAALGARRAAFIAAGATATDHDVPVLHTERLDGGEAQRLLDRALGGRASGDEAQRLYGHLLVEMACLSAEDGLVMQIHAGVRRSTNRALVAAVGPDTGSDIPVATDWVNGLGGVLDAIGNDADTTVIAFTVDESAYARELAPMAGHWPALKLGPPWWFHDSPNGMARYFDAVVETAGYGNLAGFNDDTRALMSIPARHDLWRRAVARHLAAQVADDVFDRGDAESLARWLSVDAARETYKLAPA